MPDTSQQEVEVRPLFIPNGLTKGEAEIFAVYFSPKALQKPCHAVIHVPAFAEEMNKARRMISLQARSLANAGIPVLVLDLFGTGDSRGDFSDASWCRWRQDLELGCNWLESEGVSQISLWALRAGALLACDVARSSGRTFRNLVLWQPVSSGEVTLMQFLRLRVAASMFAKEKTSDTTKDLKSRLLAGETVLVAGYPLPGKLAQAMLEQTLMDMPMPRCTKVDIIDLVAESSNTLSPVGQKIAQELRRLGCETRETSIVGEAFWSTQEIVEVPELVEITNAILTSPIIQDDLPDAT